MEYLRRFELSPEEKEWHRAQLLQKETSFSFIEEPRVAALVSSLGIQREVLTVSNELVGHVFDAETGREVQWHEMRSELVASGESIGVRIWVPGSSVLTIVNEGLAAFVNPRFSLDAKNNLGQLVFFPESVDQILRLEGGELVIVPEWGLNTIFGGFDPGVHFYQTNLWEIDNNDTLRFARLLGRRQIPLLGTHDLTAHSAGVRRAEMDRLAALGDRIADLLGSYFSSAKGAKVNRASLIIPYLIGVLLDDLAQPVHYGSKKRLFVIDALLEVIRSNPINLTEPRRILRAPRAFRRLIEFTRSSDDATVIQKAPELVSQLVGELQVGSRLL